MKKNTFVFLIFSLLFLFSAFYLNKYFQEHKYKSYLDSFQKVLFQKEKSIEKELYNLKIESKNGDELKNLNTQYLSSLFSKEGFIFLIYKNDSLQYWTNNAVPVSNYYNSKIFDSKIYCFNNGWFEIKNNHLNNINIIGLILIKNEFKYQNEFLKNDFQNDFPNAENVDIRSLKNEFNVYSVNDKFLFSFSFGKKFNISESKEYLVILLYLFSFILFAIFLFKFNQSLKFVKKFRLHPYLFLIELLVLIFWLVHFHFPEIIFNTQLFNPYLYAASEYLPSLGHLLIYSLTFLFISIFLFKQNNYFRNYKNNYLKWLFGIITFLTIYLIFCGLIYIFQSIIINSQVNLNFNNIFTLTRFSLIVLFIFSTLIFSFFLLSTKLCERNFYLLSFKEYLMFQLLSLLVVAVCCMVYKISSIYLVLPAIVICYQQILLKNNKQFFSFSNIFFSLILFSLFATLFLNHLNNLKEKQNRSLFAVKLSAERDPVAEFLFDEVEEDMLADKKLISYLKNPSIDDKKIINYIQKNYFEDYWLKFNIQITICQLTDSLLLKPEDEKISCDQYFQQRISHNGIPTKSKNLFFIDDISGRKSYLAIVPFEIKSNNSNTRITLYFDITSKFVPKDLAYPQLLVDQKANIFTGFSIYSYAKYYNGNLVSQFGRYYYSYHLDSYKLSNKKTQYFDLDNYNHLFYKVDDLTDLIISIPKETFLNSLTPFSYLALFFGIYFLIIILILKLPFDLNGINLSFKNRLQFSIISVIIISFFLIGIASVFYIIRLNENKNNDIISEKAHSILVETEQKLSNGDALTSNMSDYIEDLLIKFSNTFFTDINLYDLKGNLIASSRPKIFDEGLISEKMNAVAYSKLSSTPVTLFIHNEKIGELKYYSAYTPLRNDKNEIIAYLNLPYYAKQSEFKDEISNFIATFINIYLLLIALAIAIIVLASNYIARPLKLIKDKISQLSLGKKNEKIAWKPKDEIGSLINEYNRMIDELQNSAEALAKSERESAWREMAKQIAHEIKNPLTPMRLGIQNLHKAWKDKSPDIENRFDRFRETILEQIDTLSAIASGFSDFATMPQAKMQEVDLKKLIQNAIELYKEVTHIQFIFEKSDHDYIVLADKDYLLRVFNNLIKNSVQALAGRQDGLINIEIFSEKVLYIIKISDNGPGILEDKLDKIFLVSFTTKSSGMGLGLTMTKSMIESMNGKIWFHSEKGRGVAFFISLFKVEK